MGFFRSHWTFLFCCFLFCLDMFSISRVCLSFNFHPVGSATFSHVLARFSPPCKETQFPLQDAGGSVLCPISSEFSCWHPSALRPLELFSLP